MEKKYTVVTRDLTKTYDDKSVVNKLNLRIPGSEIFGFLGVEGAGKTTTILMLLGLVKPTSGSAIVLGHDSGTEPLKVKQLVGYLAEQSGFYDYLTAFQNLKFTAEINQVPREEIEKNIYEAMNTVGIRDMADKVVGEFSSDATRLLALADILTKKPALVILEEPFEGVSDKAKERINEVISSLPKSGITVVLVSSHFFQIQKMCNRIGVLLNGKLVVEGLVDHLGSQKNEVHYRIEVETRKPVPKLLEDVKHLNGVIDVEARDSCLILTTKTDIRSQLTRIMNINNAPPVHMRISSFNVSDIYNKYFREREH